ncbi:Flp family type IVb pilin [Acetobacter fabarum]|uniref:Flp family type IVb pilin n=2 Tax=Acetobacter fabarum TaxID=483199 RepID=UPI0015CF75E8|nr:Flp family type IVb pilin [Acetobacter fabarum]
MIYYKKKIQQDVGATAVEYGILSALIAVVTILGLQATGTNLGTTYCTIANQLSQAVGAGATASGCSATPSSNSSSGSADSSGSSADSSSSDSSGSSDSSSDSSSSSSTPATYDASNSYYANDKTYKILSDNLGDLISAHVQSMTGIYDANGNELTNPKELATAIGVSDADYQMMENLANGTYPDPKAYNLNDSTSASEYNQAKQSAQNANIANIESDIASYPSASMYIPDLSKVSMTGTVRGVSQTATMDPSIPNSNIHSYQNSSNTFGGTLMLYNPTGD